MGTLTAQRMPDGSVRLMDAAWPQSVVITEELLEDADPRFITHGDGMVRFLFANGEALYGITGDGPWPRTHEYELISGTRSA